MKEETIRGSNGQSLKVRVINPPGIALAQGVTTMLADAAQHHVNYLDITPGEDQLFVPAFGAWASSLARGEPLTGNDAIFNLTASQSAGRIMNKLGETLGAQWLDYGADVALRGIYSGVEFPYGTALTEISYCRGRNSIFESYEIGHEDLLQCHSAAGENIMLGLLNNLSERAFRDGMRATYAHALENSLRGESLCQEGQHSLCAVWQGFITQATPANAAIAEPIINEWYFGSEQGYVQD